MPASCADSRMARCTSSSSWAWLFGTPWYDSVSVCWLEGARGIPGTCAAVQSTTVPRGDRLFDREGGLEGAPYRWESGGGVTP